MDSLLDRFCRYVQIETTAREEADTYPSSPGQLQLGALLAAELQALGVEAVEHDQHGIVTATLPANVPDAPAIAWVAHIDTSPEYTAHHVRPIVHRDYRGNDLVLPGDPTQVIRVAENPTLLELLGHTLITSDGTTLLGADDKCGLAVIMTAVEQLMANPRLPHGTIRVVFTCDEEIGRGTQHLTRERIGAPVAYTLDGEGVAGIENETFSADLAIVTIRGRNTHPGFAQAGGMINAIRLAAAFVDRLPWLSLAPETTAGKQGFLHPYGIEGGVPQVTLRILLRSFETEELAQQADLLRTIARTLVSDSHGSDCHGSDSQVSEFPQAEITVQVQEQYRNMREHLAREPRAVQLAEQAVRNVGLTPQFKAIRGGTDGSKLSEMGVPTPNLATGMHNFHSPLEYASLQQMEQAVAVLLELAQLWSRQRG